MEVINSWGNKYLGNKFLFQGIKATLNQDSRLASVHTTGKMSRAAVTRSINECKMWIERIRRSRLDTDSEVRGLNRSNNMGADVGGRSIHAKEHSHSKASWIQKNFDLPRIQQSY